MFSIRRRADGTALRRIVLRFKGIFATTNKIEVRGKTYQFTEESLRKVASSMIGTPVTMGHRGLTVGYVEKAWYSNGKLWGVGAIFEPQNTKEQEAVDKIRRGEVKHLSPAFSYDLPKPTERRVVLHGNLEVVGRSEDGGLLVRGTISRDDLRKIGIEDLKNFKPNRIWFHDGSKEAKKSVETASRRRSANDVQ